MGKTQMCIKSREFGVLKDIVTDDTMHQSVRLW